MFHFLISLSLSIFCMSVTVTQAFLIEPPYLLGTYILRKTNDISFDSKYTYLLLNENSVKLKTIYKNWIIATKKSRTGSVTLLNDVYRPRKILDRLINQKKIVSEMDVDLVVRFNSLNKYTYSVFGIEFPEIKYEQITDYNIQKNIRVQVKGSTLYITDDFGSYYIFDICPSMDMPNRMPYVETALYTLVFTEVITTMIDLGLMKLINNN